MSACVIASIMVCGLPGYVGKVERDIQSDRKHPFFWRQSRAVRDDVAVIWRNSLARSITFFSS